MPAPTTGTAAGFYDDLAASYHRIYPDWEASSRRQGDALHAEVVVCADTPSPPAHRPLLLASGPDAPIDQGQVRRP
jgi:hypothetical protein